MKFIVALLLTASLSFISGLYFPWWGIAIASFLTAILVHQLPFKAFMAGFLGVFLLWGTMALIINIKNQSILAGRMGALFGIGNNPILLVIITGLLGGLIAGLAAIAGSYSRQSTR